MVAHTAKAQPAKPAHGSTMSTPKFFTKKSNTKNYADSFPKTSYLCWKIHRNGKKTDPLRLGDEKIAPPQSQLRYPRRVFVGVAQRRSTD